MDAKQNEIQIVVNSLSQSMCLIKWSFSGTLNMKNFLAEETRLPMYYVGCAHWKSGPVLCVYTFCLTIHLNKVLPPMPSVLEAYCADI